MMRYDSFDEWYQGLYRDRAAVIPAARSYALLHERAPRSAVLLVHGYAGYPGELVSVAHALYEAGLDCFVPRLPGMGTSGSDFVRTSRFDWLSLVDRAARFLSSNYDSISILGHSMGCLLSVIEATAVKCSSLVLAMPAFRMPALEDRRLALAALVRKDIPTKWAPDPRYHLHYEGAPADDLKLGAEYYSHLYPRQLVQLSRLVREATSARGRLDCPTLILASRTDAVTDPGAVEDWAGKARIEWIDGASHFVFYDIDEEAERRAIEESVDFISSHLG